MVVALPAASVTRNNIVPLPVKVTPEMVKLVPLRELVTLVHVTPLSNEADKVSVASSALLKVAVTVCAAVLVMKSVALEPVSAEKAATVTALVGAKVSPLIAKLPAKPAVLLASV